MLSVIVLDHEANPIQQRRFWVSTLHRARRVQARYRAFFAARPSFEVVIDY